MGGGACYMTKTVYKSPPPPQTHTHTQILPTGMLYRGLPYGWRTCSRVESHSYKHNWPPIGSLIQLFYAWVSWLCFQLSLNNLLSSVVNTPPHTHTHKQGCSYCYAWVQYCQFPFRSNIMCCMRECAVGFPKPQCSTIKSSVVTSTFSTDKLCWHKYSVWLWPSRMTLQRCCTEDCRLVEESTVKL